MRALAVLLLSGGVAAGSACGGDSSPPERTSDIASESGARRLSNVELDNTIRDLLGDDSRPATRFSVADQHTPYDNDIRNQLVSEALVTSLEIMAGDVAERLLNDPPRRDALVGCQPSGAGDEECFRQFVEDFLPKALRRPVDEDEVDAFLALQAYATEDNDYVENDFHTAVDLVVRAVLQHPEFLYRVEGGEKTGDSGVLALDDFEIASRMSYLLWATMPDEALFEDAKNGLLTDAESRRAIAERMMEDDRAKVQMRRFHAMWLGHRILPQPAELVSAFSKETGALIDRVVFDEPQDYNNILTMPETFVDDFLADHYGLPRPEGGEGWVTYEGPPRAGILSHGSVLASFAKFADTSPTQRGILIRTRLLCDPVDPPPPTADADNPPGGEGEALCKFDRYAEHRESPGCASCHDAVDPIGFGLENFDMQGRFREHDDGLPECIIDGEGLLPGIGEFTGPAELGQRLIESTRFEACMLENLYQFAIGREVDEVERPVVDALVETFAANGNDLRELLLHMVSSERFSHRRELRIDL